MPDSDCRKKTKYRLDNFFWGIDYGCPVMIDGTSHHKGACLLNRDIPAFRLLRELMLLNIFIHKIYGFIFYVSRDRSPGFYFLF
jgi:hypothetical protein